MHNFSHTLFRYNADYILVGDDVTKPNPLRDVPGGSAPDHCVFERLGKVSVDLRAHVLDRRVAPDDQRFAEVWICSSPAFSLVLPSRCLGGLNNSSFSLNAPLGVYPH